ncbi:hypothetical protein D3C81_1534870 [compost metagenome]
MKTYTMHVIDGNDEFHVSTGCNDEQSNPFVHAYRVFSACCSNMLWGFGDAKSTMLYNLLEKQVSGSMSYKHQGQTIFINIKVSE